MSTKLNLLEILNNNTTSYLSGQDLAARLGLSRNSIWKAIKTLQNEGFEIDSKAGVGYRLLKKNDVLSPSYIKDAAGIKCRVHILDEVDSTNNYAKKLTDLSCPGIVVANSQTEGRGRRFILLIQRDCICPWYLNRISASTDL